MTVGGGGGSPKTISRVIYNFASSAVSTVYTCPIDTMAIIDPLMIVNPAGGGGGLAGWQAALIIVKSINPVTAAPESEQLSFYASTLDNRFFNAFAGAVSYSNGASVLTTPMNVGRFEFTFSQGRNPTAAGTAAFESFSKGLILYPGELFSVGFSPGAGSKMVYGLREYGISS